ncbi:hypothetical protein M407DRAFT_229424 [Tulasnella calospora MUT 4182]|uniref:Uncharacterized protein n=1 Tax=Tulasnella calospora MUT 4182 TaxID=1051891 RepID=A0A0C3M596_9AGAM|nr:hypothetical protein M407DRAFT_229424 [Tulasnella calospora MUT 4182]
MALSSKRALPAKETALFKSLLQLYETRQYKKALKVADQILKKAPKHGETTSMKGLVLTNLNRKEEGIQLVKAGITLDIDSHICWHVFGIVHKADRNYEEALKCYLQALKFDKDNINILRDSAQLQVQLRQYEPLQETRLALLKLRPNVRLGWVGLTVAYHLNNKLSEARTVLQQYLKTVKGVPDYDFEFSELLTYYVTLTEETGDYADALQLLESYAKDRSIVDKSAILTIKARLLQKLGRSNEAAEAYDCLLVQSPESFEYYQGYFLAKGIDLENISDETRPKALELFQALSEALPKATSPRRLALDIASGDIFRSMAGAYLQTGLVRGVPSLFSDVKALYRDTNKQDVIGELVLHFSSRLAEYDPTTYVWSLYFLAQHHSHVSPTKPETALHFINTALEHTPTLPELYMIKARILKRCGDPIGASQTMEDARMLDFQDRFLNTKSAKYLLRDGLIEQANSVLGLFTKKDAPSPGADLEEMQSLLYLLEEGRAYRSVGKLSLALKRYRAVEKTFSDFEDDQYDFHSYCLRRHTLNAYHGLLRFEDTLRSHPAYVESALAAAEIYIRIYDGGAKVIGAATSQANEDKEAAPAAPVDDDPDGLKLLNAKKPLEEATKLVRPLEELLPLDIRVWTTSFDLALRRGKYLQAIRALRAIQNVRADDPELHYRVVLLKTSPASTSLSDRSRVVLAKALDGLTPPDVPLEELNTLFLQKNPGSAAAAFSYCRSLWVIKGQAVISDVEESLLQLARPEIQLSIEVALGALEFLQNVANSARSEEFRQAMVKRFPLSTVFKTESEKASIRTDLQAKPPPPEEPGHE